jgi:hypothetical protein
MSTTTELMLLDRLTTTARAYGEGHHLTVNEVSKALFSDPRKLGKLNRSQNPHDLRPQDYATAMALMSKGWPTDTVWPDDVPRPGL